MFLVGLPTGASNEECVPYFLYEDDTVFIDALDFELLLKGIEVDAKEKWHQHIEFKFIQF